MYLLKSICFFPSGLRSGYSTVNGHLLFGRTNAKTKPKKHDLKVACWNVKTMFNNAISSLTERRSTLIAHELSSLYIVIAALSTVRLADDGSLQEAGAGFTFFWSGKMLTDRRLSGVRFMARNPITSNLEASPTCHSDRIIFMRLLLKSNEHLTLFCVNTPIIKQSCLYHGRFHGQKQFLFRSAQTFEQQSCK